MESILYLPIPLWAIGLVVMLVTAAVAVLGMFVVRENVHKLVAEGHNDVAGFFFTTVGVVYAVLLAFQVFAVWERYGAAETAVQDEASAEISVLRLTVGMPQGIGSFLTTHLHTYAELEVNDEWSRMASGGSSIKARDEMNLMAQTVDQWQPTSTADAARYTELLLDMDQFSSLRNIVNFSSRASLPQIFWLVLIGGGTLTVAFTWLFHMENAKVQAIMTGTTAALIVGCLFLILALNQPFAGPARVTSDPFAHMLDHFGDFTATPAGATRFSFPPTPVAK